MKRNTLLGNLFAFAAVFAGSAAVAPGASAGSGAAPTADPAAAVNAANDSFYAALNAMFVGEFEPMNAIWSHRDDVTLMSPFGGRLVGWDAVGAEWKRESGLKLGGRVLCKDLLVRVGGDMAYTVGVEEGENMTADGKPVAVRFRATNIFRLEAGQWHLVHHHTDTSQSLQSATFTDQGK
ncbi:MAG TPA: nuclear transport factor 2 family protein [Opitutus sp.]|nr:nuclear transport factor 2 family protein [Opitutus sp.]